MPLVRIRALTSIATSTPSNAAMASSVMLMPASQQAERAVLQFQRHAFGGRTACGIFIRRNRTGRFGQLPRGDPEQQCVADLTGGSSNGDGC
jgi:hypothetical protein